MQAKCVVSASALFHWCDIEEGEKVTAVQSSPLIYLRPVQKYILGGTRLDFALTKRANVRAACDLAYNIYIYILQYRTPRTLERPFQYNICTVYR